MKWAGRLKKILASIGVKIVLPYLLLTLVVAGAGAYIVTNLVTSSLQERFNNQLLDAGRVVAESMVEYERARLDTLRRVTRTQGVPAALAVGDSDSLAGLVPQILASSTNDAVELLDMSGKEVFGWQRPPNQTGPIGETETRTGSDYSGLDEVSLVLDGFVDEFGDKRVLLTDTPHGLMLFTIGPVFHENQLVGAAMVGTYVQEMLVDLTETAVARVTIYDRVGHVIGTTLGTGQGGIVPEVQEPPSRYPMVIEQLQLSTDDYHVVSTRADSEVPLRQLEVRDQQYTLAYGDWRLRGQSFGLFSVALPSNFITNAAATSRTLLSVLFAVVTVVMLGMGVFIAERIIQPLNQLVRTAIAVAQGNLKQRTGIERTDEIGTLATSFDSMTEKLVKRNRQLLEQASQLETILNSIADGVLVLNPQGKIITSNPAATRALADMSDEMRANMLQELPAALGGEAFSNRPRRFRVGNRTYSALAAPMKTPEGDLLGSVVALRDVTREAEAEYLQDGFITSISHELRTPLAAVKGYSDLLVKLAETGGLKDEHTTFLQTISINADHLVFHINKLIDISEVQAGTLMLQKEPFDFVELVSNIVDNWRDDAIERGLEFSITLPDEALMLTGDKERLGWAVDNLLSNACNYTPSGSVTVNLFAEGDTIRLDVIDTGVGIVAADQPYLFSRFFRANNNNEATFNVDGVGLGLFITRSIVELHDGKAWAVSKVNEGSAFSLSLPFEPADSSEPNMASEPEKTAS